MASRFWVGGTGTWDASDTSHWAASTGGASGQSVPGSADTVTFDANSGAVVCTVNTTVTVQSITCGAMGGTLDFSVNNNNVTLSAAAGFNGSGAGTRTINLGNGKFSLTGSTSAWNMGTTTGLTFAANSSTIEFSGNTASTRNFTGGALTYNALSILANTLGGAIALTGSNTFSSVTITGFGMLQLTNGTTQTITTLTLNGASGTEIFVTSNAAGFTATLSVAANAPTMTWCALRDITGTGGASFAATSSFDLGHNSGITITAPASAGGMIVNPGMTGGMHG